MGILPQILTTTDGKEHSTDPVSYDLIKKRTVYLIGEVNNESAISIITQLKYLDGKSGNDINLIIDSPGGSVADGLAIHDVMKSLHCDVSTIGVGQACSMGAFLLAAGTHGKRYVTPNTEVMIHQPLGGVKGQATDISLVAAILASNCGKELLEISNLLERDYWMSAQQAKDFGIADYVGFPNGI